MHSVVCMCVCACACARVCWGVCVGGEETGWSEKHNWNDYHRRKLETWEWRATATCDWQFRGPAPWWGLCSVQPWRMNLVPGWGTLQLQGNRGLDVPGCFPPTLPRQGWLVIGVLSCPACRACGLSQDLLLWNSLASVCFTLICKQKHLTLVWRRMHLYNAWKDWFML